MIERYKALPRPFHSQSFADSEYIPSCEHRIQGRTDRDWCSGSPSRHVLIDQKSRPAAIVVPSERLRFGGTAAHPQHRPFLSL